ncbi:MAG TPA: glycerol-3-phosphate acyltransferase [Roseiflexaceae bacterium]|nr:glycerol-3-phosphate acyltransferase [Roseiflexaceae bacterium]
MIVLLVLACYALGCFTAAYYLVHLRTGQDIRTMGSGTVGARNAGRTLGRAGFAVTFAIDVAKGALAVGVAQALGVPPWAVMLAAIAVVAGHIWPAQLGFHGGKGLATALGAMLVYDYRVVVVVVILGLLMYAIFRKVTLSLLAAMALTPVMLFALGWPAITWIGLLVLAALIILAHRKNLHAELSELRPYPEKHDAG